MQEFHLEIKNEKLKTYRVLTFFIVFLNVMFFLYSLFDASQRASASVSLAFILLYLIYRFHRLKRHGHSFYFDEWIYFLLMLLWANHYLPALVCMVLFLSYGVSLQKIIYSFDALGVRQKNFPWKKYSWSDLSNVMVKDNMLTIDFKNNKILQREIFASAIAEKDFNNFARGQLMGSNDKIHY